MKILIVKTSSIGDVIQAFPVIEYLRKKFPEAEIDWVVEKEYLSLVSSHPGIRKAIPFSSRTWRKAALPHKTWKGIRAFSQELKQETYDILFDLQGNIKSAFITLLAKASEKVGLGWKSVPEFPNFFVTKHHIDIESSLPIQQRYLQIVQRFFDDKVPFTPATVALKLAPEEEIFLRSILVHERPRVMIACGSKWENKKLSEETLKAVVQKIDQQDHPYFYFVGGNQEERDLARRLQTLIPERSQVVHNLSFPVWQRLMQAMDLVVAVDSAALALCGTTETASLSFFGPSLASIYKPLGERHRAWQGACPYGVKFETRCPRLRSCKTGACLKSAQVHHLFESK